MITNLDDATLVAYVDGELDGESVRVVEIALKYDAEARERLGAMRASADLLQACFADFDSEPVPEHLIAAAGRIGPDENIQRRTTPASWRMALPLAASLAALVVGLGTGFYGGQHVLGPGPTVVAEASTDDNHWLHEMAEYYVVHASDRMRFAELGADSKDYLEQWFGQRLKRSLVIPDLSQSGATFVGGRLMAVGENPAGLLIYRTAEGKNVGLCITFAWKKGDQARKPVQAEGMNVVYWLRSGYAYTLLGDADPAILDALAERIDRHFLAI